jgi:hypothetical protein
MAVSDAMPLQFDSEVIRLFIECDTLRVEGIYRFLCAPYESDFMSLFYPFPEDSLLGAAWTVGLDCRTPAAPWRPLEFFELPKSKGSQWRVPLTLGDTLDVRVVYRQVLLGPYARYIVSTTRAWPRPLRLARFEVFLPEGAEPRRFSYPFRLEEDGVRNYYLFEARDFLPEDDIIVEWEPRAAESHKR